MADPLNELQALRKRLTAAPQTLEQISQGRALLWQELGWSTAQIRLWLRCLPDIQVDETDAENPSYRIEGTEHEADLGEIIARVMNELDRPVPLAQLRTKLPPGILVTDPMIRAAVQSHPALTLTGPLVRLVKT